MGVLKKEMNYKTSSLLLVKIFLNCYLSVAYVPLLFIACFHSDNDHAKVKKLVRFGEAC